MAVIRIERGGPTIWPWVMGLLVVALAIWGFTELIVPDRNGTGPGVEVDSVRVMPE